MNLCHQCDGPGLGWTEALVWGVPRDRCGVCVGHANLHELPEVCSHTKYKTVREHTCKKVRVLIDVMQ